MRFRSFHRHPDGTYERRRAKHMFSGLFPSAPTAPPPPTLPAPPPVALSPTGNKPGKEGAVPSLAGLAAAGQMGASQASGKTLLGS